MNQKKALIAMSGGVDSSVAAFLMLQQGYECIGATMKLFDQSMLNFQKEDAPERVYSRTCCSLEDVEDARNVAFHLGIPYYVFNFTEDFRTYVMDRFVEAYEKGDTPNPCIECNRYLKFGHLLRRAQELQCDLIVTGHYARIEQRQGRYVLRKSADEQKDQTYVLYHMTQEELAHTCFPLGEMTKEQIRQIAQEQGLVNAKKPDSQDICFVPDGDYVRFLMDYTGHTYPEGDFLDRDGHVLGTHKGAVRYTVGQRKGLGIAFGEPMYVHSKDMEANTVTLSTNEELFQRELWADDVNWISIEELNEPMRVCAKIRYRHKEQPAVLYPEADGTVRVVFDEPQRAITPGQSVVFYDGEYVVGGGRIR